MFNLGGKKETKELLNSKEISKEILKLKKENEELKKEIKEVRKKQEGCLQKIGVVRFNPFRGEGGNQSFSIALLDEKDDGVVVTSLYSKEGGRVYAKEIKSGASEYTLSEEERGIIEKINNQNIERKKKKNG